MTEKWSKTIHIASYAFHLLQKKLWRNNDQKLITTLRVHSISSKGNDDINDQRILLSLHVHSVCFKRMIKTFFSAMDWLSLILECYEIRLCKSPKPHNLLTIYLVCFFLSLVELKTYASITQNFRVVFIVLRWEYRKKINVGFFCDFRSLFN